MDTQDEAARHAGVIHEEAQIAKANASTTTQAERNRAFGILFISLACMGAGQTVLYAIVQPLSRQLGLSALQAISLVSISALIWVFSSTFWGTRSDFWGRKPVMLLGLLAFATSFALLASVMLAGLHHLLPAFLIFPLMVAARSLYGMFGSGTAPAAQAYVADRTLPHERLEGVSTIGAAFSLGTMVGPGIATLLAAISLLAPFYFISALAVASAAAIWFLLPERTPPKVHEKAKHTLRWYDRRILPFVVFAVGLSIASAIPIQTMGFFFMDVLKIKPDSTAEFILVGQMASSMSALFAQLVIVQRFDFSARNLTTWGLGIALASNVIFLLAHQFGPLVFALVLSGLGFGMSRPGFTSGASLSVAPHEQGAVAGIISGASATGFIVGPMVGVMYEISPFFPYAFAAVMVVALFAFSLLSPTLRNAGIIPPDSEIVEESTVTPVANA